MHNLRPEIILAAKEYQKRQAWIAQIRGDMFDRQLAVHDDPCRRRAVHPGRRSGKSTSMPMSALLDALDAGFNEAVIMGAETKEKAKGLHWLSIQQLVIKYGLPFTPNGSEGSWVTPWGSKILFWGLKDKGKVELLRGYKVKSAYFDEVATYAHLLKAIITAIGPALSDVNGSLTFAGTPSFTRKGYWADICRQSDDPMPGWSIHHWTIRENKKTPVVDVEAMLAEEMRLNGWESEADPEFRREWLGEFVNDPSFLVYRRYDSTGDKNKATTLPVDISQGHVTIGVDFGMVKDPCAWTVLWSQHGTRDVYVLEAQKHKHLLPSDAAVITKSLAEKYNSAATLNYIVGDSQGLGAPYVTEYNRLYSEETGYWIHHAEKLGKLGAILLFNSELASGRLKLMPEAMALADEWTTLPWKNELKDEEDPKHSNDLSDSCLYAYRSHLLQLPKAELPPLTRQEQAFQESLERKKAKRHDTAKPWYQQ